MADRIPLIVNPNADQIQELPSQDKLLLSGHLEFDASAAGCGDIISTGGNDAIFGIFNSTRVSNNSSIAMHAKNSGGANTEVASFVVGASNKIEFVSKGEVTAVQPACLLTVPKNYTANNADTGTGDPHEGGTNFKPISFTNTTTNVNCTTSLASNATVNSGISSITVPSAGTYLVSGCISGEKIGGAGSDDQVRFGLSKSGVQEFPSTLTYPTLTFGGSDTEEFNCTFTLPLTLSANDILCIHLSHIATSSASINLFFIFIASLSSDKDIRKKKIFCFSKNSFRIAKCSLFCLSSIIGR